MPVILDEESVNKWLQPSDPRAVRTDIQQLIQPWKEESLEAYSVRRLRGKAALGNIPEATEKYIYSELPEILEEM